MPKQRNPTPQERELLREEQVERRLRAGLLDPDRADAAIDALIRKNIREHGA